MNQQTITAIILSGRVASNRYIAAAGDIYLYRNDDRSGALSRRGRHTNYGYSGYYLASVFDGVKWRKLQFNEMVEYESRSYELASLSGRVYQNLSHLIARWQGRCVHYDAVRRSFI